MGRLYWKMEGLSGEHGVINEEREGIREIKCSPFAPLTTRNREFLDAGKIVGKHNVDSSRCFSMHLGAHRGKIFPSTQTH